MAVWGSGSPWGTTTWSAAAPIVLPTLLLPGSATIKSIEGFTAGIAKESMSGTITSIEGLDASLARSEET